MELHKEQMKLLHRQTIDLEKSIHPQLIPGPDVQRLLWIPGIGKNLLLCIINKNRFQ